MAACTTPDPPASRPSCRPSWNAGAARGPHEPHNLDAGVVLHLIQQKVMSAEALDQWTASARGAQGATADGLLLVVLHAVYAPGHITSHRLRGAVVLYLNVAVICASAFSLIWALNPTALATLAAPTGGPDEFATMLYFSLTTLTTTGYGDIVPVDPFARSLANLESVTGQFYLAVTVARLVTLEMEHRAPLTPQL
jgi:Ion channel